MTQNQNIFNNLQETSKKVDKLASQCVKCALCLPHCPTYTLTKDENESPRGRIALFQAVAQAKLPLNAELNQHLDLCLGCRACERVCPAHVEYGELLIEGRSMNNQLSPSLPLPKKPFSTRILSYLLTKNKWLRYLPSILWTIEKSKIRALAKKLRLPTLFGLEQLEAILPPIPKPFHFASFYPALGEAKGTVALFSGCVSSWCDQQTLWATISVLRRWGMNVHLPQGQTCCGAIALHAGELAQALQLAQKNQQVFDDPQFDHIITVATGCSAVLQGLDPTIADFSSKIIDIMDFLAQQPWPQDLALQPVPCRVMIQTPCTRRNVLKTPLSVEAVLSKIPEIAYQHFSSPDCCGAAGTYMLDHPTVAEQLALKLLSTLPPPLSPPMDPIDFIATTNIGCALHLANHLKNPTFSAYGAIQVGHPITLLAKALDF